MARRNPPEEPSCAKSPAYSRALDDAECLLQYAAEVGTDVDDATRAAILHARTACTEGWTEEIAANLLAALTKLTAHLQPVTPESAKGYFKYRGKGHPTQLRYLRATIVLAAIIVPVSVATFITSALSANIASDITTANALAVKLAAEKLNGSTSESVTTKLGDSTPKFATPSTEAGTSPENHWLLGACGTPKSNASLPTRPTEKQQANPESTNSADLIADLQEYASLVRLINYRARRLDWFVFCAEPLPRADSANLNWEQRRQYFELTVGIPDPAQDRDRITDTYQDIRFFAQTVLADVSVFYGAFAACILPVLYAMLGACAFVLRSFETPMSARTYTTSYANYFRFPIAFIGGIVVGLFNFTLAQGASISPLAIAFLVGYAVDVFFAFLEGLLKQFTKPAANGSSPGQSQPADAASEH
jgi:hypothetical protein